MDRRLFIKNTSGAVCLLSLGDRFLSPDKTTLRFGLITDLHFAERQNSGTRIYSQSGRKLIHAVEVFNSKGLDFVIELGDFKDQGDPPDRKETLTFLDSIEKIFRSFNGPVYHVLGNHDMDSISKSDFLKHTSDKSETGSKTYYSFRFKGMNFIVMDANYNEDGSDYDSGNFDWTYAKVPDSQLKWLRDELSNHKIPTIVFIHQLLDGFSGVSPLVCVRNADEVVRILEESSCVMAVFQGHHHDGNYSERNGIHYFTMKAMVEGSLPENNSFAVIEIDSKFNIIVDGFGNCRDMQMKPETNNSLSDSTDASLVKSSV